MGAGKVGREERKGTVNEDVESSKGSELLSLLSLSLSFSHSQTHTLRLEQSGNIKYFT